MNFSLFSDDPERVATYLERPVKVVCPRPTRMLENDEPKLESPESSQGSEVSCTKILSSNIDIKKTSYRQIDSDQRT